MGDFQPVNVFPVVVFPVDALPVNVLPVDALQVSEKQVGGREAEKDHWSQPPAWIASMCYKYSIQPFLGYGPRKILFTL